MGASTPGKLGLVVVGAGASRRMGGTDKVWAPLGSHPIVWYSLTALAPLADSAVLVVREDQMDRARAELSGPLEMVQVVAGGAERQESVARGLAALDSVDLVAIHDAARPFIQPHLLRTGIELLRAWDGAIPVEPLRDTVKQVDAQGRIVATLDRALLRAAQTPQIFRRGPLEAAHEAARAEGRLATDDAALLEDAGFRVTTFPGLPDNFKITTFHDLLVARQLLREGVAR